jgi:hypothetical protein
MEVDEYMTLATFAQEVTFLRQLVFTLLASTPSIAT